MIFNFQQTVEPHKHLKALLLLLLLFRKITQFIIKPDKTNMANLRKVKKFKKHIMNKLLHNQNKTNVLRS